MDLSFFRLCCIYCCCSLPLVETFWLKNLRQYFPLKLILNTIITSRIIDGSPTMTSKTIIIIKLSKRNSKKNQKKLKEKKTEITKVCLKRSGSSDIFRHNFFNSWYIMMNFSLTWRGYRALHYLYPMKWKFRNEIEEKWRRKFWTFSLVYLKTRNIYYKIP